jgi:hypothetical protein
MKILEEHSGHVCLIKVLRFDSLVEALPMNPLNAVAEKGTKITTPDIK